MKTTANARHMRKEMTEAERALWYLLRARRFSGFKFRRQVPLGPYIADFLCFEPRLVVEADGSQHADNGHDKQRDSWFETQGYRVLRFWNREIFLEKERVADTIYAALTTPHPALRATFSHEGRRENPTASAAASHEGRRENPAPAQEPTP